MAAGSYSFLPLLCLALSFSPLVLSSSSVFSQLLPGPGTAATCPPGSTPFQKCTQCSGTHPDGCVCDDKLKCVPYCGYVSGMNRTYPGLPKGARACTSCHVSTNPATAVSPNDPNGCLCSAKKPVVSLLTKLGEQCLPYCNEATVGKTCKGCNNVTGAGCACGFERNIGKYACVDQCQTSPPTMYPALYKCKTCENKKAGCLCGVGTGGKCVSFCVPSHNWGQKCKTTTGTVGRCGHATGVCNALA